MSQNPVLAGNMASFVAPWHVAETISRLGPATPRLLAASERTVLRLLQVLRLVQGSTSTEHAHACFARGLLYRERTAALSGSASSVRRQREQGFGRLWTAADLDASEEAAARAEAEARATAPGAQAHLPRSRATMTFLPSNDDQGQRSSAPVTWNGYRALRDETLKGLPGSNSVHSNESFSNSP